MKTAGGGARPERGRAVQLGVIGAAAAEGEMMELAREVGRGAAVRGWTVLCGGLGGVMEGASEGAADKGGLVVGILPGPSGLEGNLYLKVALPTNMGHARNALIAQAADVLIAIGGGYGTLSEMALGLKMGKPVISLRSWQPDGTVLPAHTAAEALERAAKCLGNQ